MGDPSGRAVGKHRTCWHLPGHRLLRSLLPVRRPTRAQADLERSQPRRPLAPPPPRRDPPARQGQTRPLLASRREPRGLRQPPRSPPLRRRDRRRPPRQPGADRGSDGGPPGTDAVEQLRALPLAVVDSGLHLLSSPIRQMKDCTSMKSRAPYGRSSTSRICAISRSLAYVVQFGCGR